MNFKQLNQTLRIPNRQIPQQHRIDKRKDLGARRNAQRDQQDRGRESSRSAADLP